MNWLGQGIGLANSGNNTLRNNVMSGNDYNFDVEGESYSELDNDIDTSNLVDGKPIYYLVDVSDTVIDSATNAGTFYCIHCDNVTVKDLDLTKNGDGVHLYNTSNSRIENNSIYQCFEGFRLWSSSNNIITGNSVRDVGYGIVLWMSSSNTITANNAYASLDYPLIVLDNSDNNTVTNNNVSKGYDGIFIQYSNNNTITNNTASNSYAQYGISLEGSDNNVITGNNVSNNVKDGINLEGSSNNTISGNTAISNKEYGICLDFSSDNRIYNNYFENTNNSYDDGDNTWNITKTECTNIIGGPYLGGNYWSDYAGEDLDGDGLGDTLLPYNCSGDIQTGGDYLPLVTTGEALPIHNIDTGKNFSTIQAAIYYSATQDGHTITVDPGTYTENVDVNKSLTVRSTSGNPDDTIVTAANSSYSVFEVTADYVTISGFTVTGATEYLDTSGIYLIEADYCNISDIKASNNGAGIYLYNSSNNTIKNNAVNSNNGTGIVLDMSSKCNTITNNTASTNGVGIGLGRFTSSNIVTDNIALNNGDGIRLYSSSNNKLTNNNVSNNNYGIHLLHSSNNTFSGNTALNNTDVDFDSDKRSSDNSIEDFTIFPTTISFMYEHGIQIKAVTAPEPDPAGKVNIGKYVNVTNVSADSWILLNISYSDADVTNVEEDSLRLYRWTDTDWAEIPGSGVNTAENYVYANVTTFSQIAAFGDPTIKPTPTPTPAPRRGGGGGGSSGPCDTDGDGYGDIDEIIMGTDPYDPCDPDPTCIACLASIGGRVLPKPAVKPQATPKLVPTPEPAPTSRPAPTPVPEPEKPGIPGFEAVFAVAGLLAVAYLMRRKKK